jgi:hypothetical protein
VIGPEPAGTRLVSAARWLALAALLAATALAFRTAPAPAAAAYVCPMHPEVHSDGPGTCPLCSMALEVARPRPPGGALSAGEQVLAGIQVMSPVAGPAGAWWIPVHAVVLKPGGASVFVTRDGRTFQARAVEAVRVTGPQVAVRGTGLEPPARVVAAGALFLDARRGQVR